MCNVTEIRTHQMLTAVTFTIGGVRLAVPASDLREILEPLPTTRVPGAGDFASSVLNVRGAVLPLANLHIPLGITPTEPSALKADAQRILVLEVLIEGEPATVAINADIVHEVATIPVSAIDKLPATSGWPPEFVRGLFRHTDETFVLLPNLSAIFTAMAQCAAVA